MVHIIIMFNHLETIINTSFNLRVYLTSQMHINGNNALIDDIFEMIKKSCGVVSEEDFPIKFQEVSKGVHIM